jgi:hypothetical protein
MKEDNQEEFEEFHLADAIDAAILMHRDAHFSGSFDIMLEYYEKEGKGVHPDFDLEKIYALMQMENATQENLAGLLLTGADAEKVARAKKAYKDLRQLYEIEKPVSPYPKKIADLILTEDEEATAEIAAIVEEKSGIVPDLLELIKSPDFHDPLFPGYGLAPLLAIKCLGQIGDKRAIISLFESIGNSDFFDDDVALSALKSIGEPAKQFLLTVVKGKPFNIDNEKAAIALIAFKEDPEVATTCLNLLQESEVMRDPALATYLILVCEGLTDPIQQALFKSIATNPKTPKILQRDFQSVIYAWKERLEKA